MHRKKLLDPDHEVVIIGAGLGGLGAAIELRKFGVDDVVIVERADAVGGTWRDNTYPGIGVDVPAQAYQFSYHLNPGWSRMYAKGAEVRQYVEDLVDTFDVRDRIRFGCEVTNRVWDEDQHFWRLTINDAEELTSRFVIAATGPFPKAKKPQLPGLEDFRGVVQQTAAWDHSVDLRNKRVAVIGTGASAVQIVPAIAGEVERLDVYQRTPIWILPKIDPAFPPIAQALFAKAPWTQQALREILELTLGTLLVHGSLDFHVMRPGIRALNSLLRRGWYRMQVRDKKVRRALTPDYDLGCKRPAFSNEYLPTFNRTNVNLLTDPIERVTETGIRTVSGAERDVDVIIQATGFHLAFDPEVYSDSPITGANGFDLAEFYRDHRAWNYHATALPQLPNYFTQFGQYGWTGGTWHTLVETSSVHISRVIVEAARRRATRVSVRPAAVDEWMARTRKRYENSLVAKGNCGSSNSYYIDRHGEFVYVRPASTWRARKVARTFPLDDYEYRTADRQDDTAESAVSGKEPPTALSRTTGVKK